MEYAVSKLTTQTATLQAAQTHKQRKDDPEVKKATTKVGICMAGCMIECMGYSYKNFHSNGSTDPTRLKGVSVY